MRSPTRYLIFVTINLTVMTSGCTARHHAAAVSGHAATTCPGGTVGSDVEAAAYAGCLSVIGDLRIRQSLLVDLTALSRLHHVSGTLEISHNPQLEDLRGLAALSSVAALRVLDNPELEDLRGLEGLKRVQSINIERNGIYDSVGLGNLREIGHLVIRDNPKLISLRGFHGLEYARSIEIRNNPRLAAYYGLLPRLQSVEEQLVLRRNLGLSARDVREVSERVLQRSSQAAMVASQARP